MVVSAHWLTRGTRVLAAAKPRTIHAMSMRCVRFG